MTMTNHELKRGAIILAGGQSRRMGRPKAWLPFGPERLLTRVLRILQPLVCCRVVVAAPGQDLPELPDDVIVTEDRRENRGPLEGLNAGLLAGGPCADVFYTSSCDVPLLRPEFVNRLFQLMRPEDKIVVPKDERHFHPLAAVYHRDTADCVARLLEADQLRPFFLFERVTTHIVDTAELRDVDPELESLRNLNTPEDYQSALRVAGLATD